MSSSATPSSETRGSKISILQRKEEHLDLAAKDERREGKGETGFETFRFVHCALPEMALDDITLKTTFLGKALSAPFMIGSMTGGPSRAAQINRNLALAAEELGIAMGVGSQRVALENAGAGGINMTLRRHAPNVFLVSNIGGVQLAADGGQDLALRAIEAIEANAILIHLNPLQEALQPDGDTDWRGVLSAIETLCALSPVPVVVKEVGNGISGNVAKKLVNAGVSAIDAAGSGGTSWAWIESQRQDAHAKFYADTFADWGLPTADAIRGCRSACPDIPLIGSGGIRNGVQSAKALHLGADIVSISGGVLDAALQSPDAVVDYFYTIIHQLRIVCFASGISDVGTLRHAQTEHM